MPRPRPATARRLLLVLVIGICVMALFPFVPDPPRRVTNQLERSADGVLVFTPPSIARSDGPPGWLPAAITDDAVTVSLEAASSSRDQDGPARILTVSRDYSTANLQIGQEAASLVVRLRRPESGAGGDPWFEVPEVFDDDHWHRIDVSVVPGRVTIDVDGDRRIDEVLGANTLADWDRDMPLALGNAVLGERPWWGRLRRATVTAGGEVTDYTHPSALIVPTGWWRIPERLREPASGRPLDRVADIVHAMAFLALGLLAVWARPRAATWRLVAGMAAFAVLLLVAKVFVAGRHPSARDVVIEVLAGAVGVWWARRGADRSAPGSPVPAAVPQHP